MNKIKSILRDNKKIFMMSVFLLLFLTACVSRNADGTIDAKDVIGSGLSYGKSINDGWFNVIVWPVAQLINVISQISFLDAGIGIVAVTVLLNLGTAAISIKSQVANQKMQMIQPEVQKIQAKYQGKTDQNSRMRLAQEQQALYKKHEINPMGALLPTLLQFPIIIAVYQAVLRAEAVINGSFLGINLTQTPMDAVSDFNVSNSIPVMIIFVLMVVFQFISFKIPQILAKRRKEKSNIKTKEYAQPKKQGGMAGSMNTIMYFQVGMIAIFAINWPLGMSFYWLVGSITRVIQNVVIDKYFIKDL